MIRELAKVAEFIPSNGHDPFPVEFLPELGPGAWRICPHPRTAFWLGAGANGNLVLIFILGGQQLTNDGRLFWGNGKICSLGVLENRKVGEASLENVAIKWRIDVLDPQPDA